MFIDIGYLMFYFLLLLYLYSIYYSRKYFYHFDICFSQKFCTLITNFVFFLKIGAVCGTVDYMGEFSIDSMCFKKGLATIAYNFSNTSLHD